MVKRITKRGPTQRWSINYNAVFGKNKCQRCRRIIPIGYIFCPQCARGMKK